VEALHDTGACSEMLVVTYDNPRPGSSSLYGQNMEQHELPFLRSKHYTFRELTSCQFMLEFGTWQ